VFPRDSALFYNLACTYARLERPEEAVRCLREAVEKGFSGLDHMEKDPDLETIRGRKEYAEIVSALRKKAGK